MKGLTLSQKSDGWRGTKLGNEIDLLTGFPFESGSYSQRGIRLCRGSNIKRGSLDWAEDISRYWSSAVGLEKFLLQEGDIVVALDGSLVGRSFGQIRKRDLPALLVQRVARIRSGTIDPNYLLAIIGSRWFVAYCDSVKTVTAIPHISPQDIRNFWFPLPPLPEQRKIAEILSTWDEAIEKLDQLIEKKKLLKKGLMQQLLTGKKRFPGFTEPWREVRLGEVADIRRGASPRPISNPIFFASEGPGWVRISDVTGGGKTLQRTDQHLSKEGELRSVKIEPGDLIMSICATIGVPKIAGIQACIHDGFVRIRPYASFSKDFLYHLILSMTDKLASGGQPGTQKNLNTTIVENIFVPNISLPEQQKITMVLDTIDQVVDKLIIKKELMILQKEGLMQQLLSGKLRIVL